MKKKIGILILMLFYFYSLMADGVQPNGSGTDIDPYHIATLDNLLWISTNNNSWNSHFIQTADIDASNTQNWNEEVGFSTIGDENSPFSGCYDGQNFTIDGLYINNPEVNKQGFFGRIAQAVIQNLGLTNVNIVGNNYVGGMVGDTYDNSGRSYFTNCYTSGTVNGYDFSGGLIGGFYYSDISSCFSTCNVSGNDYVGGFVGNKHYSTINNSYSKGNVTGNEYVGGFAGYSYSNIDKCYSIGSVIGNNYIGGFAGGGYFLYDCFWDIETSGQTTGVGWNSNPNVVGKTTSEMQIQYTFSDAGWDFPTIWNIDGINNNGYPYLSWQLAPLITARFSADNVNIQLGEVIQFTDLSTASPTSWQWDFDNNGTIDSVEENPSYTYTSFSSYTVSLTVSDGINSDIETKIDYITVFSNDPPASPSNVQVEVIFPDAIIFWTEVDSTIFGDPVNLDGYIVLNNENLSLEFNFLNFTPNTAYTHTFVSQYQEKMYYKVVAIKNFNREQIEYLEDLNNSRVKNKWSILKQNLDLRK